MAFSEMALCSRFEAHFFATGIPAESLSAFRIGFKTTNFCLEGSGSTFCTGFKSSFLAAASLTSFLAALAAFLSAIP